MSKTDIKEIESVFFDAMSVGWAADAEKITDPVFPGSKIIEWNNGAYKVIDCYYVVHGKGFGTTTIWHNGTPVWFMNYYGEYAPEVMPFLKNVLLMAYAARKFFGGRGPTMHTEGSLCYFNTHAERSFTKFHGIERVFDTTKEISLGWHEYNGRILI